MRVQLTKAAISGSGGGVKPAVQTAEGKAPHLRLPYQCIFPFFCRNTTRKKVFPFNTFPTTDRVMKTSDKQELATVSQQASRMLLTILDFALGQARRVFSFAEF